MEITGYVAVFKNEDGSFSTSDHIHSTEICAITAISMFEGRKCYGVVPITFDFVKRGAKSGMMYRLDHSEEIKELFERLEREEVEGFGAKAAKIK